MKESKGSKIKSFQVAEVFIRKNYGKLAIFDEALKAAEKEHPTDNGTESN